MAHAVPAAIAIDRSGATSGPSEALLAGITRPSREQTRPTSSLVSVHAAGADAGVPIYSRDQSYSADWAQQSASNGSAASARPLLTPAQARPCDPSVPRLDLNDIALRIAAVLFVLRLPNHREVRLGVAGRLQLGSIARFRVRYIPRLQFFTVPSRSPVRQRFLSSRRSAAHTSSAPKELRVPTTFSMQPCGDSGGSFSIARAPTNHVETMDAWT